MLRNGIIIAVIFGNASFLQAGNFWYFSPGLRIGWNFSGNFTVDTKISVGVNTDDNLENIVFYNITFGFNALSFAKNKSHFNRYNYIQFQTGKNLVKDDLTITGIGAGFIFNTTSANNFSPFIRLFAGFLFFPELDILFLNSNQTRFDFGIRGVLPILLRKTDLGFN